MPVFMISRKSSKILRGFDACTLFHVQLPTTALDIVVDIVARCRYRVHPQNMQLSECWAQNIYSTVLIGAYKSKQRPYTRRGRLSKIEKICIMKKKLG